jgi:alpha-1,2-mannosyltransferase
MLLQADGGQEERSCECIFPFECCNTIVLMKGRCGSIRYYSIFTRLYSLALLFSDHIMTNSSWTQAHIASLLYLGRTSFLSGFMDFGPEDAGIRALALQSSHKAGGNPNGDVTAHMSAEPRPQQWIGCEVVYPPCDTAELAQCGKLEKRERIIVSLAQFR